MPWGYTRKKYVNNEQGDRVPSPEEGKTGRLSMKTHLMPRSSKLFAGDSGRMGNTMRLGHTTRLVRVSRRKGSSHVRTKLAEAPPPSALPKLRLKWIRGGRLHAANSSHTKLDNVMPRRVKSAAHPCICENDVCSQQQSFCIENMYCRY